MLKRVVVTGMGGLCAFGSDWPQIHARLRAGRNAVRAMLDWGRYADLMTHVGAPIDDFAPPSHWTRHQLRSMSRVSQLAVRATEFALTNAKLLGDPVLRSGATGVACGSSIGSPPDTADFALMLVNGDTAA